jgi:ABC-2 type transport system permease protein
VLANLNLVGRAVTLVYYTRALTLRGLDLPAAQLRRCQDGDGGPDQLPPPLACLVKVLAFGVAVSLLSALWFARSEYRVKTPGDR